MGWAAACELRIGNRRVCRLGRETKRIRRGEEKLRAGGPSQMLVCVACGLSLKSVRNLEVSGLVWSGVWCLVLCPRGRLQSGCCGTCPGEPFVECCWFFSFRCLSAWCCCCSSTQTPESRTNQRTRKVIWPQQRPGSVCSAVAAKLLCTGT